MSKGRVSCLIINYLVRKIHHKPIVMPSYDLILEKIRYIFLFYKLIINCETKKFYTIEKERQFIGV